MSQRPITLWLLNRVLRWDHKPLIDALSTRYDVHLGRRIVPGEQPPADSTPTTDVAVNIDEQGAPGELMHEGARTGHTQYDEYFVPIPQKCLGGRDFWNGVSTQEGQRQVSEAFENLGKRLSQSSGPEALKKAVGPHFGDVRLNSCGPGYYEMLSMAFQSTGRKNILVGYSQGGTVARYLAFLDERVSIPERRCIEAVVTVQSPNRGSPVASADRSTAVSLAIVGILLSLPGWLPTTYSFSEIWKYLARASSKNAILDFVTGILDGELASWPAGRANDHKRAIWSDARKWLSGLSGLPELAFWDLDPARLSEPGAVLNAINKYPLESIQHGGIVGTDNSMPDIIFTALRGQPWYVRLIAWINSGQIRKLVELPDKIYKNEIMAYSPNTPSDVGQEYTKGITDHVTYRLDRDIPEKAHDFIIPSVSQMLLPVTKVHLGHRVNPYGSHLSGAIDWQDGRGRTDEESVVALLRNITPSVTPAEMPSERRSALPAA